MKLIFLITFGAILAVLSPQLSLVLTPGILILCLVLKNPSWGLVLTIGSIILGQLARLDILLLTDILLALTIGSYLLKYKKLPNINKLWLPFMLFVLWTMASWLVNFPTFGNMASILYLARLVGYFVLAIITPKLITSKTLKKILFYSLLTLAILGLAQIIIFPDLTYFAQFGWDPHQGRLVSTWLDPNFTGLALILGLLISILLLQGKKQRSNSIAHWLLILTFLLTIILTFSRSSYLALGIALIGLFALHKPSRKILGFILVFILALTIVFPRSLNRLQNATKIDQTARFRIESWQNTWQIAKDNLWFGVGYNNFQIAQIKYGTDLSGSHSSSGSDSSWLLILATTGLIGLVLLLWFYVSVLRYLYNRRRNNLSLILFCFLLALFFHSQFVNSLLYSQVLVLWLPALGLISSKPRL